jgi:transposase InsO family protein
VGLARLGELDPKKSLAERHVPDLHSMISELRHSPPELSVRFLCRLLGVSRSWLYDRATQPTAAERDTVLPNAIEQIILEVPGYGYRRVTKALQRDGWEVNHKRVLRVMRQESLLCQHENANVESFFKTLKRKEVWLKQYRDFREAEANLGMFIEDVYNWSDK